MNEPIVGEDAFIFFTPLITEIPTFFWQLKSYIWKINSFELEDAQSGLIHNNYWCWFFQGVIYQIFLLWCLIISYIHFFYIFILFYSSSLQIETSPSSQTLIISYIKSGQLWLGFHWLFKLIEGINDHWDVSLTTLGIVIICCNSTLYYDEHFNY